MIGHYLVGHYSPGCYYHSHSMAHDGFELVFHCYYLSQPVSLLQTKLLIRRFVGKSSNGTSQVKFNYLLIPVTGIFHTVFEIKFVISAFFFFLVFNKRSSVILEFDSLNNGTIFWTIDTHSFFCCLLFLLYEIFCTSVRRARCDKIFFTLTYHLFNWRKSRLHVLFSVVLTRKHHTEWMSVLRC